VKGIVIAIDGYSGCGKSTTAREVAHRLGYNHIDSGAMYRAVTLAFLRDGIRYDDAADEIQESLKGIKIQFANHGGEMKVMLNGIDVSHEIRSHAVSELVSEVSAVGVIRREMVKQQREIGKYGGVVMDGRDIGTVVFPAAELKIFMVASLEKRVQRRLDQDLKDGIAGDEERVKTNLMHRDEIDTSRIESPLIQADDAILLDNTNMTEEEQVGKILNYANLATERKFAGNG